MHSQRLNLPPLNPWVIAKKDGEIITAHCDCAAGLGECCSHVGGVLYEIEDAVRNHSEHSVTDVKAYWKVPSNVLGAPSRIRDIDYSLNYEEHTPSNFVGVIPEPTNEEKVMFFAALNESGSTVVLNVVEPFATSIQEENVQKFEKQSLQNLYNPDYECLSLEQLVALGKDQEVPIGNVEEIANMTKAQAKSPEWFTFREGRITASVFKNACITRLENPSLSTIKRICYPKQASFKSKQTIYGCNHEKQALNDYTAYLKRHHVGVKVWDIGFIINPSFPYFGASPDSLVECQCCGKGCIEVKCPYCIKDTNIEEILNLKTSFLNERSSDGTREIHLDRKHAYFYQVQMQIAVIGANYCDFVAWNHKDFYCERIFLDENFWQINSKKALLFHERIIMPELLAKYFTKKNTVIESEPQPGTSNAPDPGTSSSDISLPTTGNWCKCKKSADGSKMMKCYNPYCKIVWFHPKCIGIKKKIIKQKWFCQDCSKVNFAKKK